MATQQCIEAFPADIDRTAFGHWLSGFCDGEGCFILRAVIPSGRTTVNSQATFRLAIRADDLPILRLIQSFLGCGHIAHMDNTRSKVPNAKPAKLYFVAKTSDLVTRVIAHFDKHPLRAKKANDYRIWKEGVLLMWKVQQRPLAYRPGRSPARHGGTFPKWTDQEREHYRHLVIALREQRAYGFTPPFDSPPPQEPPRQPSLFD